MAHCNNAQNNNARRTSERGGEVAGTHPEVPEPIRPVNGDTDFRSTLRRRWHGAPPTNSVFLVAKKRTKRSTLYEGITIAQNTTTHSRGASAGDGSTCKSRFTCPSRTKTTKTGYGKTCAYTILAWDGADNSNSCTPISTPLRHHVIACTQ